MKRTMLGWILLAVGGCARPETARESGPVIVQLAGRDDVITVRAAPEGPRYWQTTRTGHVLVQGETLPELRARHPQLYERINAAYAGARHGPVYAGE